MVTQEVKEKAQPHDGTVPDNWELVGMSENRTNRFRYYRTPMGKYYFTVQNLKKTREPKIEIWDAAGHTFARRRYKRRMYEAW